MAASGCDRKAPEVWGQSLRSSDARARKAAEIPPDPNIEEASEKHDSGQCQSLWQRSKETVHRLMTFNGIFKYSTLILFYNGIDKESTPLSNYTANLREHILEVWIMVMIIIDYCYIVEKEKGRGHKKARKMNRNVR